MTDQDRSYKYGVLGAGRQGTAAAYDLIINGNAQEVRLADANYDVARLAAERVNSLTGTDIAKPWQVDVNQIGAVVDMIFGLDVFISAVPFQFNLSMARAAIQAGTSMCDLGGKTDITRQQIELDGEAQTAGISIVPDCGMGPGMNNTLGAYVISLLDDPQEVYLWDGGLPQDPQPPWHYQSTFSLDGLLNEYVGEVAVLRDGKITMLETFTEYELIDFPPLGKLEAFITSGGTSTAPWSFEGKVQVYQNKTTRWVGHHAQFKAFKDAGLFSTEPISHKGQQISPREVFLKVIGPQITAPLVKDVCMLRAKGVGLKNEKRQSVVVDMLDYYDEQTGFTAMEKLTGWHAAIIAIFIAQGKIRKGATPQELAVPASDVLLESHKRGFKITEKYEAAK